ncbi:MAG: GTPase HflX [Erysipelotrichales bacterium]|nr:GTPase HflX [Erysipelotrichales bacterium]
MANVLLIESIISKEDITYKHLEMLDLLKTLEISPTHFVKQELIEPYTKTYLGSGKVHEIHELIIEQNIDLVVCNFDLSPVQYMTLKDAFDIEILDRTGVILQIFSRKARSKEARLQAEIANLKYLKSRLVDKEANYSQVTSGGGYRNKGSGEKQIDLDRSKYKVLLKRKELELEKLVTQRKNNRNNRSNLPIMAIVGYTNAGKSTLLNQLLKKSNTKESKNVIQEDKLFATLETSTRLIDIYEYPYFLLTDTVGFISNLPTMLVEAFKSTLEEISDADLLIHVVDVSNPNFIEQIKVTNSILKELNCENIPTIYLYNKLDKCKSIPFIPKRNELLVSMNDSDDLKQILDLIFNEIKEKWDYIELMVPFSKNVYMIKKYGFVENLEMIEDKFIVKGYFPTYHMKYIKSLLDD